mmetsp:Transcript_33117/g.48357  ORF Transcript_33117/g.48357 Transcript_33117/m.48357 type:complete len:253 (+) Transcript_33117:85-843(+)
MLCLKVAILVLSMLALVLSGFTAFGCWNLSSEVEGSRGSYTYAIGYLGVSRWGDGVKDTFCTLRFVDEIRNEDWIGIKTIGSRDAIWYTSFGFAVVAFLFGLFGICFTCCSMIRGGKGGCCIGCWFFTITLFQGLSFLIFRSRVIERYFDGTDGEVDFGIGPGTAFNITALVLWFICGILSFVNACQDSKDDDDHDDIQESEFEESNASNPAEEPLLSKGSDHDDIQESEFEESNASNPAEEPLLAKGSETA